MVFMHLNKHREGCTYLYCVRLQKVEMRNYSLFTVHHMCFTFKTFDRVNTFLFRRDFLTGTESCLS